MKYVITLPRARLGHNCMEDAGNATLAALIHWAELRKEDALRHAMVIAKTQREVAAWNARCETFRDMIELLQQIEFDNEVEEESEADQD